MVKRYQTDSPDETLNIAASFGKSLPNGSVVLFYGDLGAGKTAFIKGIAQGACQLPASAVVSPTFSLMNVYKGTKSLFHFDLYRIRSSDDFFEMGFDEYLKPEGITCIEWSERLDLKGIHNHYKVHIEHLGDNQRSITISEEQ